MGNLQVEVPVLQTLICWLILLLKRTTLSPTVFPMYVSLWSHIKKHLNLLSWVYLVNAFAVEKLHSEKQMWKALV